MTEPWATILVILLGITDTVQLHLAKAMQRQGIEIYDQFRAKIKGEKLEIEGKLKKPLIYFVGLVLNSTEFIWLMLANTLGKPPGLFTGMLGIGLVVLLVYSNRVMDEAITRQMVIGAVLIVIGTAILGLEGIARPDYDEAAINVAGAYLFLIIVGGTTSVLIAMAIKTRKTQIIGFAFGIVAGSFGGMDIIFKLLGQSTGGSASFIPTDLAGWLVFGSSFLVTAAAFVFTNWGFARKSPATVLIPAYDTMYVI
nr:hypothetical protein [Candidatus Sigynarchaeota archaeon]